MSDDSTTIDQVRIGDRVAYRLSTGELALGIRGKVIAVLYTRDGQTLADVQWDTLGAPRRLHITSLTRA